MEYSHESSISSLGNSNLSSEEEKQNDVIVAQQDNSSVIKLDAKNQLDIEAEILPYYEEELSSSEDSSSSEEE